MRYLLSQLKHRKRRAFALGVAILVASTSFSLLLSTVQTTRLEVVGTVKKNFRPAYDILVRPERSFTDLERSDGLVRSNYLGGIFGGITFQDYGTIKKITGVEVAAPIANIAYIMPFTFVPIEINDLVAKDPTGANLYKLSLRWRANNGLSNYPDYDHYVYYTHLNPMRVNRNFGQPREVDSTGKPVPVCEGFDAPEPTGPFSLHGRDNLTCFSSLNNIRTPTGTDYFFPPGVVGAVSSASFPVLLAAIDPVQEEKLVDFSDTLTSGRALKAGEKPSIVRITRSVQHRIVPLIASTRSYLDEELTATVGRLDVPAPPILRRRLADKRTAYRFVTGLGGTKTDTIRLPSVPMYEDLISLISGPEKHVEISYSGYWTSGPTSYTRAPDGTLQASPVRNRPKVFEGGLYPSGWAPQQERDTQFRKLAFHAASNYFSGRLYDTPALRVVGRFDPEKLPGFSPLSEVPLETYYPPKVQPVTAAVREVLDGRPLLPTQNIGGYVAQPPLMLTTLAGARAMTDPTSFEGANEAAPISVIRVRVAGVSGPDPLSRERIRRAAQQIHERTGLAVDVTAGSSPRELSVQLPAGKSGAPAMTVKEGWVEKGVAVSFLRAVDAKSLVLFVLVLVVCGFFLANGAFASVAARRRELGVLACLGWSRAELFRVVLGEFAVVGALAGIAGVLLVLALVGLLELDLPLWQALLVAPVSVALTAAAGLLPARRASRLEPLAAIAPPVTRERRARSAASIARMALINVRRVLLRAALGAAGLFVGVAAFTVLITINAAFQGQLAGTIMGEFISLQVRGVDLVSVLLIIALGAVSVADVMLLNVRERSAELVTLDTIGWTAGQLRALLIGEGLAVGALGSVLGAAAAVAVMGPSGSGKSTMLHLIGAMDRPDSGTVGVKEVVVSDLAGRARSEYRRKVGFVFQRFHLLPALTVLDNVAAPLLPVRTSFDKFERAQGLLDAVGLGDRATGLPARLSGGQQQRVAIARALMNDPDVLLADEPTGNLDSKTGGEVLDLMLELREQRGMTVIVATHDPMVAERCGRIVSLVDGRIIDDRDPRWAPA